MTRRLCVTLALLALISHHVIGADLPYLSPEAAPKFEGKPGVGVPLGRFSEVPYRKQGWMWNLHFNVFVERGFKFSTVVPELHEGRFGKSDYAGFLTVMVNGKDATYTHFRRPEDGTEVVECTREHAVISKKLETPDYHLRTFVEMWVGYPYARFWAEITPTGKALTADYLLTGYGWAQKETPKTWEVPLSSGEQQRTLADILKPGEKLKALYVRFWDNPEQETFALAFGQQPLSLYGSGPGDVVLRWGDQPLAPSEKHRMPDLWYFLFPRSTPVETVQAFLASVPPVPPATFETRFGAGKGPWIEYSAKGSGKSKVAFVPIPPTLQSVAKAPLHLRSFIGDVGYGRTDTVRIPLPAPPALQYLTVDFPALSPERRQRTEKYVAEMLSHQNHDGAFTFSQGRPFYDGLTIAALVQLHPVLTGDLKERNAAAVRKCLDYWWGRIAWEPNYQFVYFPEPQPMLPQIDYPEISACLLYPTAAYAQLVDRSYAKLIWPKAKRFIASLPKGFDWTGSAFASPGPGWNHVLVESTIGGYLAWASLYHLARLAEERESLPALQARAAFAWQSMNLLRYRPEFEAEGFFVEQWGDNVRARLGKEEWDYTMYTWFSFIPLFSLPAEDEYGIWRQLEKQKWWEFYKKSAQRTYDWADVIAIARYRSAAEAKRYLPSFEDQPFQYNTFDYTSAFAAIAYPWLAWAETHRP